VKNFFARAVAAVVGVALLVGAFLISVVFFAAVFAIAGVLAGYLLWKTRHFRKEMRQRSAQRDVIEGRVIEGTVIPEPPKGVSRMKPKIGGE
jgi:membrane protein implicated in regulation of membrane protease activity